MKIPVFLALLFCYLAPLTGTDTEGGRTLTNLNQDWNYLPENTTDVRSLERTTGWETLDLPHTWNQWDAMDAAPGYRRDASWYRKTLTISGAVDSRYHLYFEGSNITTDVYVNGKRAGGHVGGYVGFEVDITDYIDLGRENTISIRVDNSYNPDVIPSQKADFFIYGGITRDLWLKELPALHLSAVAVSTPEVSAARATTVAAVSLNEPGKLTGKHSVSCRVMDGSGTVVLEKTVTGAALRDGGKIELPVLSNPELWSPDNPNLYRVVTELHDGNSLVDRHETTIGYRWFRFEPYGAFFLNGERLLLRGTHRHEEHAGYGAAMPNELHVRDVRMMKEMGVNFLRLGHYPQDPAVYRACNEMGIILWDELPWCRGGLGEATWRANTERLLREQIAQNYNHPSIFFWSLGNEIYWLPDFEGGDAEAPMNAFLSKLNGIAHELDPGRQTAIRKYYAGSELVDVFSPSIWSGWYAGVYTNYGATLEKNQKKYERFLHMEYGGSSHVGRHTENPITGTGSVNEDDWAEVANQVNVQNIAKEGDWTESYIVDLFDYHLSVTETMPTFAGNAQWAFKDFGTPLRPQNAIPYMNQKGLVDRAGNPKDAYYVYKSYWAKDPFTYIESHTWTHRRGPEGKTRNIPVFSNCDRVELIHNGSGLGQKTRTLGELPAGGLNWDVLFTEGANLLEARGYRDGREVAYDSMTVHYDHQQPGNPDRIHLEHSRLPNGNLLVEATLRDADGLRVYDYEEEVYFTLDGGGALKQNYGTPTGSQIIQMANGRAAIELEPAGSGRGFLEARNQDFKGSYLVLDYDKIADNDTRRTQALLLTQPLPFVAATDQRVTGPYRNRQRIEVPNDLTSQNRWFMFEGPVLENDLVAYRYYADSRHRFDIYGKTVPELVMDTVGWQYHDIMNWGSDVLKVGNSLGLGSPGIYYRDSVYTLSDYDRKTIEIVENGDERSMIRTTFRGLRVGGQRFDLVQDWSLSAGNYWSEIELYVPNGTLPPGMTFATGIVSHLDDIQQGVAGDYVYALNWGKQSYHQEQLGMAVMADRRYSPEVLRDDLSHLLVFRKGTGRVTYRFLSVWERDQSKTDDLAAFRSLVERSLTTK